MAKFDIEKAMNGTLYVTPMMYKLIKKGAKEKGVSVEDYVSALRDELILEKLEEKRNQVNTDGAKNASNIIRKLMNWRSNA